MISPSYHPHLNSRKVGLFLSRVLSLASWLVQQSRKSYRENMTHHAVSLELIVGEEEVEEEVEEISEEWDIRCRGSGEG
jgi:hypothetical protein